MDDNEFKEIAQDVIKDVNFSNLFAAEAEDEDQVNFWIPSEYKARFSALQKASKREFGKLIKEIIMTCIDRADHAKRAG